MENEDPSLSSFLAWANSKLDEDFRQIVHRGSINKREIAVECGFARSVLDQNPRVKKALAELEEQLRSRGVLPRKSEKTESPQRAVSERRGDIDAERLRRLETENALLRAEVAALKKQLAKFDALSQVLAESGRIPR